MPKEVVRKRGKRKPKSDPVEEDAVVVQSVEPSYTAAEPSSSAAPSQPALHPSRLALIAGGSKSSSSFIPPPQLEQQESFIPQSEPEGQLEWSRQPVFDPSAPFGILDPDIKAYFRQVEERITEWENVPVQIGEDGEEEREDRRNFLVSVLTELRGQELQVATDPDCALVLERLLHSMGDWGRRVVADAFAGNFPMLIQHRFGSHVCQTLFLLGAETINREAKGNFPPQHIAQAKTILEDPSLGELPTMTVLVQDLCTSLLPTLPELLTSPHASPPLRLLLIVLTPNRALPTPDGEGEDLIRSKRSTKFRANRGVKGKSIIETTAEDKGKGKEEQRLVPQDLAEMRVTLMKELMTRLGATEWRSVGVEKVGSAMVQLLLEFEVQDGDAEKANSLLDHLTAGLISELATSPETPPTQTDYVLSLLQDSTGSHLLQSILSLAPLNIFEALWKTYFVGKIGKLAGHPVANFVVASGVSKLSPEGLETVIKECTAFGAKALIKSARTSVLKALVDRATELGEKQKEVSDLICSALELTTSEDKKLLVPCLMSLKVLKTYKALLAGEDPEPDEGPAYPVDPEDAAAEAAAATAAGIAAWQNRRKPKQDDVLGANMQGCLLLQAMVGMPKGNETVLDSLLAQPVTTLLAYAHSPISSHLLDAVLVSPGVAPKYRRRLLMAFMDHYKELVEDRMGSRVGDTIWDRADGFMREKIARSLIPHATALSTSQYGRFFARKLNLHLLERRPDEWRHAQLGVVHHFAHQKRDRSTADGALRVAVPAPFQAPVAAEQDAEALAKAERKKRKREAKTAAGTDEIDALFAETKGKKSKQV